MNNVAPIRRDSLHSQIVERLRTLIHSGELAPNEKLNEKALCEHFGVSRTPLREALKVLSAERLVDIMPHYGATVTQITIADLDEVFPIIGALEGLSGKLACALATNADIEKIEKLHAEMVGYYEARDLESYFRCNEAIHDTILNAAQNPTLAETLRGLSGRIRRARYQANMSEDRWARAVAEHEIILSKFKARDASGLAEILRDHLENKLETIRAALSQSS